MCLYVANGVRHSLGATFGAYISGEGLAAIYNLFCCGEKLPRQSDVLVHYTHAPSPQCWTIVHNYFTFPYHSLPQRPCSTEIKMATHEAKLRGPYNGRFKPSSSPKRRRWKLKYVKTCLCNFLGISLTDLGVFASTLRGRWSKMVQKSSEDSQRDLRLTEGACSYPVGVCSHMHISRVSG